jgi:hypothetical protein
MSKKIMFILLASATLVTVAAAQLPNTTNQIGGTSILNKFPGYILWYQITPSSYGCLESLGAYVNQDGDMMLALYSNNPSVPPNGAPQTLLAQTKDTVMLNANGLQGIWQLICTSPQNPLEISDCNAPMTLSYPVSTNSYDGTILPTGTYWLAIQVSGFGNPYIWYGGTPQWYWYALAPDYDQVNPPATPNGFPLTVSVSSTPLYQGFGFVPSLEMDYNPNPAGLYNGHWYSSTNSCSPPPANASCYSCSCPGYANGAILATNGVCICP